MTTPSPGAPTAEHDEHQSHPLIASTSPEHYRFNPVHNGEVWNYGRFEVPEHGAMGFTFEIRFWNASKTPVQVSGFEFSKASDPGHGYGWHIVTEDTLYVDNEIPRGATETIKLDPEQFFRVSVNFGYDRQTAPAEYLATLRVNCDPGGPFEIKIRAALVRPGEP